MEEAEQTVEELSKQLQVARSEATVNKEEAKGIRKRLAGCHLHYKELQQHYDALLKQNDECERELAKADKHEMLHELLHNSEAKSWAESMDSVREKHRIAEEKASILGKENDKLQQLCNELQSEKRVAPAEA